MKQTWIFKVLLLVMIAGLSVLATDFCTNNSYRYIEEYKNSYEYEHELAFLILGLEQQTNPNYTYYEFVEDVDEEVKESIIRELEAHQKYAEYYFSDEAFAISYENHGKTVVTHDFGEVESSNYAYTEYPSSNTFVYFDEFIESEVKEIVSYFTDSDVVKVHVPTNYKLTVRMDEVLLQQNIVNWQRYADIPLIVLFVGAVIVGLFMLFYPIRIIETASPFSIMKKWKGEFNLVVLGFGITLTCVGTVFYTCLVMGQWVQQILLDTGLHVALAEISCWVLWFLTLYGIACGVYYLKHIVCNGVVRWIKEDTWSGNLFGYLKKCCNDLLFWDLSDQQVLKIIVFVGAHTLLLFLVMALRVNPLCSILYAFFMLFACKWYIGRIQDDYSELMMEVKELAKGNFDEGICQDVGVFTSLQNELVSLRDGFEYAVDEKIKSEKLKTELISHVSHDLKTPLTCIKNYVELLQEEEMTNEKRMEYVGILNTSVDRLSVMIEDLFEVSKVNSGDVKLELTELNLVALIEQAHAECMDLLESRHLTFVSKMSSRNIPVLLDSNKTYRIFENVFTNIGKYAMPNSRVYIKVEELAEQVVVEIKNVSEAQMDFEADEIMERFARGDKSRHESGSGLGLAIIKSFVEAQQGTFEVSIDADLFINRITFPKVNIG